jgi:macrodomain Ter protein organizer (MatP/YcbG family)
MGRPSTGQALTSTERAARYRARRAEMRDTARLNLFVKPEDSEALHRLARHHGVTLSDLIGLIAEKAESDTLAIMSPAEKRKYRAE